MQIPRGSLSAAEGTAIMKAMIPDLGWEISAPAAGEPNWPEKEAAGALCLGVGCAEGKESMMQRWVGRKPA